MYTDHFSDGKKKYSYGMLMSPRDSLLTTSEDFAFPGYASNGEVSLPPSSSSHHKYSSWGFEVFEVLHYAVNLVMLVVAILMILHCESSDNPPQYRLKCSMKESWRLTSGTSSTKQD